MSRRRLRVSFQMMRASVRHLPASTSCIIYSFSSKPFSSKASLGTIDKNEPGQLRVCVSIATVQQTGKCAIFLHFCARVALVAWVPTHRFSKARVHKSTQQSFDPCSVTYQ